MTTGNEPINPLYDEGYLKPSQNDEMGLKWMAANKPFIGLTIRQLALKDFMCAIVSNPAWQEEFKVNDWGIDSERIAESARWLTDTYLAELNKTEAP